MSSAGTAATFAITDTQLHVPVVIVKTENNAKLSKLLTVGFNRSVYWNTYQAILKDHVANSNIREGLDASFQGVSKLFVLSYAYCDVTNNMMKLEKYQYDKVMITQLVVCWILLILKNIKD